MSSNTDIIDLISSEGSAAVDQVIEDSARLNIVVNGDGTASAITEDGSPIPSVRKAYLENLVFKTPIIEWRNGMSVTVFNQLYSFLDNTGTTSWWYAPAATTSNPVVMGDSPFNDTKFRIFMDKTVIADIYAPKASPVFSGNPTAPTPPEGDDSSTIPTTSWVQGIKTALENKIDAIAEGTPIDKIVVLDSVTTKDLFVSGQFEFTGPVFNADNSEGRFHKITMVGSDAEIAFETAGSKTSIKRNSVTTGDVVADKVTTKSEQVGDISAVTDSLNVDGNMRADYLILQGNSANPTTRAQLVVEGIAEINTLRVTNPIEGLKADVEGLDIHPRSVTTETDVSVGRNISVTGTTNLTGPTTVGDLNITGTVTGLELSVDGLDIRPKSVTTDNDIIVGQNLTVDGAAIVIGQLTGTNIQASGAVVAGSVTSQTVTSAEVDADKVTAKKFLVEPQVITPPAANYVPDGTTSVYDITVTRDTVIYPPAGLLTDGLAGTIMIWVTQDATGGRAVTFTSDFVVIGDGTFDTSPNSVTIVQLMYRGSGSVIDTVVSKRN